MGDGSSVAAWEVCGLRAVYRATAVSVKRFFACVGACVSPPLPASTSLTQALSKTERETWTDISLTRLRRHARIACLDERQVNRCARAWHTIGGFPWPKPPVAR